MTERTLNKITIAAIVAALVMLAGAVYMASKANRRNLRTWERERNQDVEHGAKADAERARYKVDYKAFHCDLLAKDVTNKRTGLTRVESLGKIHDLLIDFMNLEEPAEVVRYSDLKKYIPKRDEHGEYAERWLYFRTLDTKPEIQNGPDGKISDMFYKSFWQGVIVRLKGDGLTKCVLIPRGHLKSTLITQGHLLWKIIREPDIRCLIRSRTGPLATSFVSDIKANFDSNKKFRRLFGDMGPPYKREGTWSGNQIQVLTGLLKVPISEDEFETKRIFQSRGKEPTLAAYGLDAEIVGGHVDYVLFEDVMGETNYGTPMQCQKAQESVQLVQAIIDPGTPQCDVGTLWDPNDAHSLFIGKDSEQQQDTSFLVATCLDGNTEVKASRRLTPLCYGAPIWPEVYTHRELEKRRRGMPKDRLWFGQMFNQFHGTTARVFSTAWIPEEHRYVGLTEACAKEHKLNIFALFDTASGKPNQTGKLDFTGGLVVGQSPDRKTFYLLDGFKEKIRSELITKAILETSVKWHGVAEEIGGVSFFAGVEGTAYTNFLHDNLRNALRIRGQEKYVSIQPVSHGNVEKYARIVAAATPVSEMRLKVPKQLVVKPWDPDHEPYDLIKMLEEEFELWPNIANEELLDCLSMVFNKALPLHFSDQLEQSSAPKRDARVYRRAEAIDDAEDDEEPYEADGQWEDI